MSRLHLAEDFRVWDCPNMRRLRTVRWVEQGGPACYAVERQGEPDEIVAAQAIEIDMQRRLILIDPPPSL